MKANHIMQARWKQLAGKAKEEWGKFTNNNVMRMQGQREQMIGVVQEKYDSTMHKAQKGAKGILKKLNLH